MKFHPFNARWRKVPITIRAAYIVGLFTLLAVILAWLLGPRSKHAHPLNRQLSPNEKAQRIVADYFDLGEPPDDLNAVWCDLLATGQKKDFYATYSYAHTHYLTVFTTRSQTPENLFHRHSKGGYDLHPAHVAINNVTYFLYSTTVGSGGYLDLYVFQYDGVGKLEMIHKEESLFQGHLWVINDRIFLCGGNHRYELALTSDGFTLTPYTERVAYIEGSANHVLAYHIENGDFSISYDGTPIQFSKSDDHYVSKDPIILAVDEQIIEDDNMVGTSPQAIRLLSRAGEFECKPSFFSILVPRGIGPKELSVSYNYETWYHIEVLVKDM